jgi:transketolase
MTAIDPANVDRLRTIARELRKRVLRMIHAAKSGHPGGSLSAADVVTVLYFSVMRIDPEDPDWAERDRFILSKGHACPALYCALAMRGYFGLEHLKHLREIGGILQGHPDMRKTPGIDYTSGSLGQGLSVGVGMAMAGRLTKREYRVFVLLGDGELDEGQIWEAAMCASKYRLRNLTAIIDYNHLQLDGGTEEIMPLEPLAAKWSAFGWEVIEIDGHEMLQILEALQRETNGPKLIVAQTIKGKGVSYMENVCDWHGRAPNDEELTLALTELGAQV